MNVNWREYFKEFSNLHGGNPVLYRQDKESGKGGYYLFPDGWMYGREASGPEMAPPATVRLRLIKDYWTIRYQIVREELYLKANEFRDLVRLQASRSAPLVMPQAVKVENDDGIVIGKKIVNQTIDFEILLYRIKELSQALVECKERLLNVTIPETQGSDFNQAALLAELEELERIK